MSTPSVSSWSSRTLLTLGARQRVGGEPFVHGRRPVVRAWHCADGAAVLLVADEIGSLRGYVHPWDEPRLVPVGYYAKDDFQPIGKGGFPTIAHYCYPAFHQLPTGDTLIALLMPTVKQHFRAWVQQVNETVQITERTNWPAPLGCPDFATWRAGAQPDLLVGDSQGRVLRYVTSDLQAGYSAAGLPLLAGERPLEVAGPACPCVVDWHGTGACDLLVGTGDGHVLLYLQQPDADELRYDRGRVLQAVDGEVRVTGPASATLLRDGTGDWLIVADGAGALWRWPVERTTSQQCDVQGGPGWLAPQAEDRVPDSVLRHAPMRLPAPVQEVVIRPPQPGIYEVHLHLAAPGKGVVEPRVWVRSSDEAHGRMVMGKDQHRGEAQAVFAGVFDLRQQALHLRQVSGALHYVGALPAGVRQVELLPARAPALPTFRDQQPVQVAAIFDAFMWYHHYAADTAALVDAMVEAHQHAGFDLLYYKLGGAAWEYPSRVPGADNVVPDDPAFADPRDRAYCQRVIELFAGFDRLQAAIDSCRTRRMRCFGWLRIQNEGEHYFGKYPISRFYVENQHLCEQDIHGRPVRGKLCMLHPQVRQFWIDLALEALDKGAHGILIDTLRHLPKVMYADVVAERFAREHNGLNMRHLTPFDPRVVDLQVTIMTEFLRELRTAMHAQHPGAPLHVRVGCASPLMGVDPGRWAREGVVDAVIIEDRTAAREPDVAGLAAVMQGTACQFGPAFTRTFWGDESYPMHPLRVQEQVEKHLARGSSIVACYESAELVMRPELARAVRRVAHGDVRPALAVWR